MPATLTTYKGLQVVTPTPVGVGGVALNENFQALADRNFFTVPFCAVASRTATTPPGSPTDGDLYIVPAGATGAWSGMTGKLALWYNSAWTFVTPGEGWHARIAASGELMFFVAGAWVAYQFGVSGAIRRFQFRINYSGTNPVSVDPSAPAPAGWTVAFSGANMAVTHDQAKSPAWVSYLGRNGALNVMRYPTAVSQLTTNVGEEATKFTCSVGTATTGAASGSSALVVIEF